ncbi:hypothetical protein [Halobacillus halophilus]|uniref:hypothetical protein n=1 Tax=Halobacillus halophilus TaxID=1570 RepID=UPI001F47D847|nr:hypothetical protein [Halobacillus halophilus]
MFFAFMGVIASILLAFVWEGGYVFALFLLIAGTAGFMFGYAGGGILLLLPRFIK